MDVRGAKLDRIAQNLVHEPDDRSVFGSAVQVGVLVLVFVNDLKGGLLPERIDSVSADAEAILHFRLNRLARSQHGTEAKATNGLVLVQPLSREEAAGGHVNAAVD